MGWIRGRIWKDCLSGNNTLPRSKSIEHSSILDTDVSVGVSNSQRHCDPCEGRGKQSPHCHYALHQQPGHSRESGNLGYGITQPPGSLPAKAGIHRDDHSSLKVILNPCVSTVKNLPTRFLLQSHQAPQLIDRTVLYYISLLWFDPSISLSQRDSQY